MTPKYEVFSFIEKSNKATMQPNTTGGTQQHENSQFSGVDQIIFFLTQKILFMSILSMSKWNQPLE